MAFWTYIDKTEYNSNGGVELDLPSGASDGDLLIAGIACYDLGANVITAPVGWIVAVESRSYGRVQTAVFYKVKTSGDTGPFTFPCSGNPLDSLGSMSAYTPDGIVSFLDSNFNETADATNTVSDIDSSSGAVLAYFLGGSEDDNTVSTPPTDMTLLSYLDGGKFPALASYYEIGTTDIISKGITWSASGDENISNLVTFNVPGGTADILPNPPVWEITPSGISASAMAMEGKAPDTAPDPPTEYKFTCVTDGAFTSDWRLGTTYTGTGMLDNTEYVWTLTQRDASGFTTDISPTATGTTFQDVTPPDPSPMTWDTEPYTDTEFTNTMVATTATDAEVPPVEYYFEETTGSGSSSSWQSSTTYVDAVLKPDTPCTYRVKARDSATTPNETEWSDIMEVTTSSSGIITIIATLTGGTGEYWWKEHQDDGEMDTFGAGTIFQDTGDDYLIYVLSELLDVPVTNGATIISAVWQLTAGSSDAGQTTVDIDFEDVDNHTLLSEPEPNYTIRDLSPTTTAVVEWPLTAWVDLEVYQAPDISSIIQEIVDRPGWTYGNNMALRMRKTDALVANGERVIAYNDFPQPKLVITYTTISPVGYPNDVFGVPSANIGKVFGVETANISKVFGV